MDRELKTLLDSYEVQGADDALIERIVQRAEASKFLPFMPRGRHAFATRAAMMAVCAVLGFSTGLFTQPEQTTLYAQNTGTTQKTSSDYNAYEPLFNPKTLEEIQL